MKQQALRVEKVYTPRPTPGCIREGYLYKRSSSKMLTSWQRRWFILDGSRLYYLKTDNKGSSNAEELDTSAIHNNDTNDESSSSSSKTDGGFPRVLVCDVLLSTVRDGKDSDGCYTFEVLSANRRGYMLQAEGPYEHAAWTSAIRQCISDQVCYYNLVTI
jgi:PH domain